jgi:hypothetical protein
MILGIFYKYKHLIYLVWISLVVFFCMNEYTKANEVNRYQVIGSSYDDRTYHTNLLDKKTGKIIYKRTYRF